MTSDTDKINAQALALFVERRRQAMQAVVDLEETQSIVDPFEASGVWRVTTRVHDDTIYEAAPELSQRYPHIEVRLGCRQAE